MQLLVPLVHNVHLRAFGFQNWVGGHRLDALRSLLELAEEILLAFAEKLVHLNLCV